MCSSTVAPLEVKLPDLSHNFVASMNRQLDGCIPLFWAFSFSGYLAPTPPFKWVEDVACRLTRCRQRKASTCLNKEKTTLPFRTPRRAHRSSCHIWNRLKNVEDFVVFGRVSDANRRRRHSTLRQLWKLGTKDMGAQSFWFLPEDQVLNWLPAELIWTLR